MDSFFQSIGYFNFVIVLGVLIFVHELGHYLVARWCGVRVETFSIGFGPEIFGWTDRHMTRWKVSVLPLGGYVKMFGEGNAETEEKQRENESLSAEEIAVSFAHKNVWQRSAIVFAGPLANFIFPVVAMAMVAFFVGKAVPVDGDAAAIGMVVPGSAAETGGLQAGDRIVQVGGQSLDGFAGLREAVMSSEGKSLEFMIERNEDWLVLNIAATEKTGTNPETGAEFVYYSLGVQQAIEYIPYSAWESFTAAVNWTWRMSVETLKFVGGLFLGQGSMDDVGGPVKIAQVSKTAGDHGLLSVVSLMALLSINLGLLNLFPIPMLDGGHLVFYFFEMIRGKPVNARIQEVGLKVGVSLLLTLMIFITINDIITID